MQSTYEVIGRRTNKRIYENDSFNNSHDGAKEKEYYKRLDYIRIISCILVFLYHLNIVKGGFLAVCTFFALSGYLNCMSALKKSDFSIKSYYISRFKKIYLPLLIVVSLTVIITKQISTINWINLKQETLSVVFGYNNFWQLKANQDYFTRLVNSPFTHLWYIAILLQFELVFPIVFIVLKKLDEKINDKFSIIIVGLLTIISTAFFVYISKTQNIMAVYYNTFARSFSILFGIFMALIHYKFDIKPSKTQRENCSLLFTVYTILLLLLCWAVTAESSNYAILMIIATFISVRIIRYATIKTKKRETKNNKIVELLSKSSYEIYLVQYPVIYLMQNIEINETIKTLAIIFATLIISFVLHGLISLKISNKIGKGVKVIAIWILVVISGTIVITAKDYTTEMKELEGKLNENEKIIEEKNQEYLDSVNDKQQEVNAMLESMKAEDRELEESEIEEIINELPVVGIGDSVLLGTVDELYKKFPNGYFDGKVSRSIVGAEPLLNELKSQGKLSDTLILALGNNGDYSDRTCQGLMDIVGDREIYWVDAVGADDPKFNERFKEFAKDYPNIHIVEWEETSKSHPEYFYADGIHLKEDGPKAYADTIYNAIFDHYLEEYKKEKEGEEKVLHFDMKAIIKTWGD